MKGLAQRMRKVLIVDDEALVRVTMRSLVSWEAYGMQVAADCNSGYQALEYLEGHAVDLLITDVKMPGISGLELLKRLRDRGMAPVTIILSGYNEFDLVREAFRLGACDYLIKAEMSEAGIGRLLTEITRKFWGGEAKKDNEGSSHTQEALPESLRLPDQGSYGVAIIEIDDFQRQAVRFQEDLRTSLEEPMWELANQIPKVKRNGKWFAPHPGHYIFLYSATGQEAYRREIMQVLKRMQSVWKNYMNLTMSVGVCDVRDAAELDGAVGKGEDLMLLAPLLGEMALINEWDSRDIAERVKASKEKYGRFLSYLYEINEPESEKEKQLFFRTLGEMPLWEAKEETLSLIALIAFKFREYDGDFFQIFPENVNYYDKIGRLTTITELERWLSNYLTWILEYLKQQVNGIQTDMVLRAKRFIADNFSNPELSLKTVADYVGLNEKYFTTKFTQKTGSTFRDYLTRLRVEKAKNLLRITDLKVYEICESIGYHNVEHFNRMFKRLTGISPGAYRKENQTSDKTSRNQT